MIIFRRGYHWKINNWGCEVFLDDMFATAGDDLELRDKLEYAVALPGLNLHLLSPSLRERILDHIERIAEATLADHTELPIRWREVVHAKDQQLYLDKVRELLELTRNFRHGGNNH